MLFASEKSSLRAFEHVRMAGIGEQRLHLREEPGWGTAPGTRMRPSRTCSRQIRFVIGEEQKRTGGAEFLALEEHRRSRRQAAERRQRLQAPGALSFDEPLPAPVNWQSDRDFQ